MKTTIKIAFAAMFIASMAGNFYALGMVRKNALVLDQCAKTINVYECKVVAVPVKGPKIVEVMPELLPPPVMIGSK